MLSAAGGVNIERQAMGYMMSRPLLAADPQVVVYGDTYRG